jgi:surfactin synthase thioesterase subunit
MYSRWATVFGDRAEVVAVALPGRESRSSEPVATDLNALARRIAVALLSTLDRPYVLFGHSMGALLAYTIAQVLPAAGGTAPQRLVMSAARPPDLSLPAATITDGDDDLIASLRELGGMPEEILEHPDLLEVLLNPLRIDLAAVSAFQPLPGPPPSCPAALVAGTGDTHAPPAIVAGWRRYLTHPAPVYALPGNHFYLREPMNIDTLRAIVLADDDPAGPAAAARYGSFAVEPFDGDEAALAALSAARSPGSAGLDRDPGRGLLRLAVRDGERTVAYADCRAGAEDALHVRILVHPDAARRGLGGLLLDECQAFAAAAGRAELVTTVDPYDEASATWLAGRGFRRADVLDTPSCPVGASTVAVETGVAWRLRMGG